MSDEVKWRPTGARARIGRMRLCIDPRSHAWEPGGYDWASYSGLAEEARSGTCRTFAAACRAAERAARKMAQHDH